MIKPTQKDIPTLIQTFDKSEWQELRLSTEGFDILLSKRARAERSHSLAPEVVKSSASVGPAAVCPPPSSYALQPTPTVAESQPGSSSVPTPQPSNTVAVRAPNLGTFYRAPKPGAAAFVEIGQLVQPDTDVCLIEVMKLFTAVKAGTKGHIRAICAKDSELIEYDQPLFFIEPMA